MTDILRISGSLRKASLNTSLREGATDTPAMVATMTDPETEDSDEAVEIALRLPACLVADVDRQVDDGRYTSRADGLRALIVTGWRHCQASHRSECASRGISATALSGTDAAAEEDQMEASDPDPSRLNR